MWGGQEPADQRSFGFGGPPSSGRDYSRGAAEVGDRKPGGSFASSSLRRRVRCEVGRQGFGACQEAPVEEKRERGGLDRESQRSYRRVGSSEERSRGGRTRKKKRGVKEREEKEKEKEGKRRKELGFQQSAPGQDQGAEEEAVIPEGVGGSLRQHRIRSGSSGAQAPAEEVEEEDEKEKRFQLREQRQLLGRELAGVNLELQRVRAGVRGDQQGSTAGPQGPWAVDLQHGQGDAEAASNSSWDLVGHREDGSPPSVPAVLQVPAGPQAERRGQQGGLDALLGVGFGFARQNGSSSRLPQPKTEEFGNDCGRSQLGCLTTSGSSPPRTGALVKQSGSPGGCKRGEAGEQNPADDKGKGKRKNRHWGRSLASQWKRRSERQGSRQGQKRQREGGEQEELLGKGARGNRMSLLSDIRGVDQSAEGFFKPHEEPFDAHGKILHPGLATVCRPVTGNPTPSDDLKGSGSALNVGPTLLDTSTTSFPKSR